MDDSRWAGNWKQYFHLKKLITDMASNGATFAEIKLRLSDEAKNKLRVVDG